MLRANTALKHGNAIIRAKRPLESFDWRHTIPREIGAMYSEPMAAVAFYLHFLPYWGMPL